MSRRLVIALATVSALGIGEAAADSVPNWDMTSSCRGAGLTKNTSESLNRCLDAEKHTREKLNKDWSTFPAADRAKCVKAQTFSPTYTELATCLEMSRDLRNGVPPANPMPQRK
jgi:hypothetical protein